MRTVETTAKSRKDAIDKALAELGAELPDVRVEILREGSSGFLGLGSRPWNVRVTLETEEEPAPAPAQAQRDRGGERDRDTRRATDRDRDTARGTRRDGPPQERGARRGERGNRGDKRGGGRPQAAGGGQPAEDHEREAKPRRGDSRPKRREGPPLPSAERRPLSEANAARGNEAAALLQEVIAHMGMEATVEASESPGGAINLDVQSPDSAILIGRKGRSLSSLQYIINRMMPLPGEEEGDGRLLVDVEKYQERRREKLLEQALSYAEKAKRTGRRMRVKPMPAQERRIVHMALQDDEDVRTFSIGDGALRSVIIAPKNEDGNAAAGGGEDRGRGEGRRRGARRSSKGRSRGGNRPGGSPKAAGDGGGGS